MPRFFFHIRTSDGVIRDPEGGEFRDLAAARQEATEAAREMTAEAIRKGEQTSGRFFEIEDEAGRQVATVSFDQVLGGN